MSDTKNPVQTARGTRLAPGQDANYSPHQEDQAGAEAL